MEHWNFGYSDLFRASDLEFRVYLRFMGSYKTEGIIIKRLNFGEADKILTVFTKHYGKIHALAKGVRKITSRKGGSVELFNWVTLFLATGKNLDIVTEVQAKDVFSDFRKDLKKVGVAYYFCELVDKLCPERQKNTEAFYLLTRSLRDLGGGFKNLQYQSRLVQNFETKLLEELGFWPRGRTVANLDTKAFIENIIERKLKSQALQDWRKNSKINPERLVKKRSQLWEREEKKPQSG